MHKNSSNDKKLFPICCPNDCAIYYTITIPLLLWDNGYGQTARMRREILRRQIDEHRYAIPVNRR